MCLVVLVLEGEGVTIRGSLFECVSTTAVTDRSFRFTLASWLAWLSKDCAPAKKPVYLCVFTKHVGNNATALKHRLARL